MLSPDRLVEIRLSEYEALLAALFDAHTRLRGAGMLGTAEDDPVAHAFAIQRTPEPTDIPY